MTSFLVNEQTARLHHVAQLVVGRRLLRLLVNRSGQFIKTEHGFDAMSQKGTIIGNASRGPIVGRMRRKL